jgi:hypothetical protein
MSRVHPLPARRTLVLGAVLLSLTGIACGPSGRTPAANTSTVPTTTAPAPPAEIRAFLTGYSYVDNTPANSSRISNPVVHTSAGGTGTYDDPITAGVGHVRTGDTSVLDWPAGTRFYVPNLRRYLVVEDTCGDGERPQDGPCHVGYPAQATTWINVWVGGDRADAEGPRQCMRAIEGVWTVVVNPAPDYAVDLGPIYRPGGCAPQFGDAVTTV